MKEFSFIAVITFQILIIGGTLLGAPLSALYLWTAFLGVSVVLFVFSIIRDIQ